ncbi:hypothetical protein [Streptomyces sp. NPDC050548]|uniref:hypothetical protein n=1 Tax=Streptomyces sp. NPDC050548 TaxID=3365629 RepID=UPI0037AE7DC7
MSATGRRRAVRLLWTALAVPVSAALTGIAFGLVYGASLTPVGWRNPMVLGFGALVLAGALGGLGFVLYDIRGDDIRGIPVRETAVAACVAATMLVCWMALKEQALHERGRAVRAVVTDLRPSAGVYDAGTEAVLADAAHHRRLGVIGAGHLAVGDRLIVTVDPRGRFSVSAGPPPATPEWLWDLAAVIAAVQALFTASLGFSAARVRER